MNKIPGIALFWILLMVLSATIRCSNNQSPSRQSWNCNLLNNKTVMRFIAEYENGSLQCRLRAIPVPGVEAFTVNEAHGSICFRFGDSSDTEIPFKIYIKKDSLFKPIVLNDKPFLEFRFAPLAVTVPPEKIITLRSDIKFILAADSMTFAVHVHNDMKAGNWPEPEKAAIHNRKPY
jgi:hypothetical protein